MSLTRLEVVQRSPLLRLTAGWPDIRLCAVTVRFVQGPKGDKGDKGDPGNNVIGGVPVDVSGVREGDAIIYASGKFVNAPPVTVLDGGAF